MMATALPATPCSSFVDPPAPHSLLLYPALNDQNTLSDLALQVRNRNYHEYRDVVTRVQLDQLLLANALIARLASVLYYVQTSLVRIIAENASAGDNPWEFSGINEAAHELQKSIITKCSASADTVFQPLKSQHDGVYPPKSFLNELSPTAANTLLKFITTLRNDPNFLSDRLLRASDHELDSLVAWRPHHHAFDVVARNSAPPSPADNIRSFHRHDPLYLLTSVVFSAPVMSKCSEHRRRVLAWSKSLGRLMDVKMGVQVMSRILNMFADADWH